MALIHQNVKTRDFQKQIRNVIKHTKQQQIYYDNILYVFSLFKDPYLMSTHIIIIHSYTTRLDGLGGIFLKLNELFIAMFLFGCYCFLFHNWWPEREASDWEISLLFSIPRDWTCWSTDRSSTIHHCCLSVIRCALVVPSCHQMLVSF